MVALRILHISDLHIAATGEWDHRLIADGLLSDLHHFQSTRRIDLVVFTGDLAYAGKADDLARGRAILIDPVMSSLALSPDRVVLVPGNHDIDRARVEPIYEAGLSSELNSREKVNTFLLTGDLGAALDRQSAWKELTENFYGSINRQMLKPMAWTMKLRIDGITFGIAALNSAWRSAGAGGAERGRMLLGEPQVHTALEQIQDADLRLVAFHHPLGWLQPFDHDDTRAQLERTGAIVLTGHEHQSDPSTDFSTRGSALYGRVGCLYQSRLYRNSYAVIDVNVQESSATLNVREWVDTRGAFDVGVNSAEGGTITLPLPRRLGNPGGSPVPFTRVTQGLVEVINRSAVVTDLIGSAVPTSVADMLVPPRFYPVPFAEVVAATFPEKGKAISRIDPLAMLTGHRVVIVSGVPGSGVTDSLLWILEKQFSSDARYLPLYIRLDMRQGKRVIDDDLREAARRVGLSIGRDDPLPQAVIAVDDVTLDSDRAFSRLLRNIGEHQDNLYVLGCHGEAHRQIDDALTKAGIQPYRMFLGPFGRKEMKQIAAKVAGDGGAKLPDQVLSVLSDKGLPRTPFVMVTLMAVLVQNPEAVVRNATAMVEAYVSVLLGRTELNLIDPMDSRGREHFLEFVAGELTRSDQFWLERQELEKLAIKYFESLRLKSSAGRAIEDLIGRKILIDDGYVGFRHATFQYLFAAKLMAEDADFAAYVRSKPLEHREIIEHAAGLSRSDRDLLAFVGSVVRPVITEWTQDVANARLDLLSGTDRVDQDIETLERTMQLTAPPNEEKLDAILDDLWERRGDTPEPRRAVNTADRKQVLIAYTALLSDVLVSSELVSDIPLRIDLLKDAIRGWSSVAVSLLQQEEEEGAFRKVFEKVVLKGEKVEVDDALEPALDRLIRVIVLFTAAVAAVSALGKRQSQGLIREVAADEDFMASAIHALVTTLLAVFLKSPGWPEQLIALKTAHGKHSFVADFVSNLALNRYQLPATTESEAATLKRFLIDDIYERAGKTSTGVDERQRLRGQIASRLQRRRTQMKLGGSSVDLLADHDQDVLGNDGTQPPVTES